MIKSLPYELSTPQILKTKLFGLERLDDSWFKKKEELFTLCEIE